MAKKGSKGHKDKIAQRKAKLAKSMETQQIFRTKDERRYETLQIIYQLKQNNLTSDFGPIRQLLEKLNEYVEHGKDVEISIPFPEKQKLIKGKLPARCDEKPMVMLKHIDT